MENFSVMPNSEGGDVFQCALCELSFGSQKSVKSHITKKHIKMKEKHPGESESIDNFDFDDAVKSTQIVNEDEVSTEAILKEYEDMEDDQDDPEVVEIEEADSLSAEQIPNGTLYDSLRQPIETEVPDDKGKILMLETLLANKETLLAEAEASLLRSQLEVSSLAEESKELKNEMKTKDDVNNTSGGE